MSQRVSCDASRTFWPRRPMASESCSSGHDDLDSAGFLVQHDLGYLGRGERVDDERRRLAAPRNDVDLFALQFLHHSLDARAAHTDAGADRVDRAIAADHRHLCAAAGIAGDGLDLDDAVIDFRHFLGEQLGQEAGMGARQEDLRTARLLAHVVDVGPHAVAISKTLAGDQFVAPQQRLGAAEFDHQVAVLGALDHAVDDFADAVLELVVLPLAFVLADALDDDLLGGLGGDAAEIDRRQRIDDKLADCLVGEQLGRVGLAHLGFFVLDRLDDLGPAGQADIAALAVDRRADVLFMAVFGAAGLLDGLLHRLQHFLAIDILLARDGVGDQQQFGAGNSGVHGDLCEWRPVERSVGQRLGGGGFDQGIRQDKFRAANVGMANHDFRTVVQAKPSSIVVGAENDAGKALAAVLGKEGFNAGEVAGKAVPVLYPGQRTIDAGRTDLQASRRRGSDPRRRWRR